MNSPLSNLTSPSRGLLIAIGAVGLIAGVMAAQATLAPTPAPLANTATTASGTGPATAAAESPLPPQGGQSGGARVVMMLTVLGGLGLAYVLMRKRQAGGKGKEGPAMSLIGQLRVGGRWQVALVKVPGKTLVLGATDKGLTLLSTIEEGDLEAQAELRRLDGEQRRTPNTANSLAAGQPDLPDLPDLDALVTAEDRVNVRPPSPQLSRPLTRPPEPFARLLEELNQLPRQSTASGPIPTAQRDRLRTPEASALRARLERYQGPTN